jgi:hypothetical protein
MQGNGTDTTASLESVAGDERNISEAAILFLGSRSLASRKVNSFQVPGSSLVVTVPVDPEPAEMAASVSSQSCMTMCIFRRSYGHGHGNFFSFVIEKTSLS